ncbi:DNA-binding protein REB1-like [Camellia sinensis]|uniref:DNA-binding protein REB1-like n=1 Tax=Camellia sinensis TaxID=4442 RepID=UPI001036D953|nr:DNA-binding protein REB1-like [Camellia sinensis]
MLNGVEDGFELSKEDKRRKKDKKKAEVSSDVELDGTQNEDIDIKDISVHEAAIFEGKMGKKTKKNKKNEASASKEVSDYNGAMLNGVEDGFELSKEDKRRKKDKKKAEVSSDVELDGTQNEDIDIKDISVHEAAIFEGKMGKKTKKNKKNEASASKEVSDYNGAMLNGVEDGFELSKEDKRRKKDKKKAEVSSDVELDGTQNEDIDIKDISVHEAAIFEGKMGKKTKKNKKNEASASKEVSDYNGAMLNGVEDGFELSKEDKRRKKDKKKAEVSSDVELDGTQNEDIDIKDISVHEAAIFEGKMGKKTKKNKKNEASASKEVSDYNGAMLNGVEDGFELSKEDKRRKKDKKKAEVSIDVELDGTHNEDINMKDYAEVDDNYRREKEKRKKKRRKLEPGEDNDESNNEIHMGGEERRCLQIDDDKDLGNDSESKARKEKKKRHKGDRKKDKKESVSSPMKVCKDKETEKDEVVKDQKSSRKDNIADMKNGEEQIEKKKTHKGRKGKEIIDFKGKKKSTATEDVGKVREYCDVDVSDKVETKKRKREKKKGKDDLGAGMQEMMAEEFGNKSSSTEDKDFGYNNRNHHSARNKMQEIETKNGDKGNRKKPNSFEPGSEDPKPKTKSKKVRFSGNIEVFPSSDGPSKGKEKNEDEKLVQGKRFSPEEDERIKDAVSNYIRYNDLGEDGLAMVLRCGSHPKIRHCWKDISAVLPHRPLKSVYYRAHIFFERAESRSWTTEELELVRKYHEQHGPKWRELADALGKHRFHLKDAWRRIKLPNINKGHWSQEEYQNLFDLVNMDLRMKAYEEKKSKHGMLRDNISRGAISDKLLTRSDKVCCEKWYHQLSSSMVAEGNWADTDDYRLLDTLFSLDACCIEDVDWDYLLDHRSGDLCRKRWNQMINHIGEHKNKSFAEQVEILTNRYCPDLLEAREAWDNKPFVD